MVEVHQILCFDYRIEHHTRRFCPKRQKKVNNLDRSSGSGRLSCFHRLFKSSEVALVEDNYDSLV